MANDEGNRSGTATNNQSSNGLAVEERRPSSQVHFTESTRGVDGPRPIALGQDEVAMSGITVYNESSRSMLSNLTHDADRINGVGNISEGEDAARSKDPSNSREEIIKPDGRLAEFRYQCGKFINYAYVEHFITFIIFCNTVLLILSTFDIVEKDKSVKAVIDKVDVVFLSIFTAESALQLIYHDIKIFKNRWHTFDLLLVIVSWIFKKLTVLRCLRILKIASKFEALQRLITALLDVIPNITAIFSLLLLVFYIFAVMFTTLFKETDLQIDYFSRLDKTVFSLFQFMTMDWQEAARECQKEISWAPLLFVLFEVVSGFIVFNLIVAVLCEALGLLDSDGKEDEDKISIEKERIDAINTLMEQVEEIKKKQYMIRKTLSEIDSADSKSPALFDIVSSS